MQRLKKTNIPPLTKLADWPRFLPTAVFYLGLLLLPFLALQAETRHIHVIKILDDNSANFIIREGCRSIDYGVDQEVQLMKQHLGITDVHYYAISGTNFSLARLQEVLDYELEYQERDIILFVYAGHGYREPNSSSRYPKLYFNSYEEAIELEDIRWQLIEKKPSLLINIVVACNATQLDRNQPPPYMEDGNLPPVASLTVKGIRKAAPYQRMFANQENHTKVLDFISADKEHLTFMTRDGGIFFNEILFAFQEIFVDELFADWTAVCQQIDRRTIQRSQDHLLAQQPFSAYQIVMNQSVVVRPQTPIQPTSVCLTEVKALRKMQKQELKSLRSKHRLEMRNLGAGNREQRQLLAAKQRSERADLRLHHTQNYHRRIASCR